MFGSAAIASLMLGCAWTVYANVFAANVYPTLGSSSFDAPLVKRPLAVAAQTPATIINNVFAALPEPAPVISAPATVPAGPSLSFEDRFAASAPQGEMPKQALAPQLAEAAKPADTPKPADAPRLAEAPKPAECAEAASRGVAAAGASGRGAGAVAGRAFRRCEVCGCQIC